MPILLYLLLLQQTTSFILPSKPNHHGKSLKSQTITSPTTTNTLGDADRSFQLGLELEKKGLARAASASFHEAATLYQCYIDNYDYNDASSNEFGHGMYVFLSPKTQN